MAKSKRISVGHLVGWFPEFLRLGSQRIRGQARLLGFAALGGIVSGVPGLLLRRLWPWAVPHPASFVVVGMAASA